MFAISEQDLADMPGVPADAQAEHALTRTARYQADRDALVVTMMHEAGIELSGPFAWRQLARPGNSFALVVVHSFGPPMQADGDIAIVCNRFSFRPADLRNIAEWLSFDLGLRSVRATVPLGNRRIAAGLQDLADRAGFRFTGTGTDAAGKPTAVWRIATDGLLFLGMKVKF